MENELKFENYADRLDSNMKSDLSFWTSIWTPEEKASALGISYSDVFILKELYEKRACENLKNKLSQKMECRYFGTKFNLNTLLDCGEFPYKSACNFMRLLNKGMIPYGVANKMLEIIESEYKELD